MSAFDLLSLIMEPLISKSATLGSSFCSCLMYDQKRLGSSANSLTVEVRPFGHEQLCSLIVLGLTDSHKNDQLEVYEEFKEQLERSPASWHETRLPWKVNHPTLPTNEAGSKLRLEQLVWKLE